MPTSNWATPSEPVLPTKSAAPRKGVRRQNLAADPASETERGEVFQTVLRITHAPGGTQGVEQAHDPQRLGVRHLARIASTADATSYSKPVSFGGQTCRATSRWEVS